MPNEPYTVYDYGATADETPWEDLRVAIVRQATEDYIRAHRRLRRRPRDPAATSRLEEVTRFFRSAWFERLTSLDGRRFMKALDQRIKDSQREEETHNHEDRARSSLRAAHPRRAPFGGTRAGGAGV